MHEFLFERGRVVAPKAEFRLVFTHVQKVPATGAVRLVARKTVTFLYRRVHHLLLPFGVMALAAERRTLGRQFKAFPTLDWMFLDLLLVAGEAVPLLDGGVGILQCA